jgi:hypothetical protein
MSYVSDAFDPGKRFSLDPLEGDEVVKHVLDGAATEEVTEEPASSSGTCNDGPIETVLGYTPEAVERFGARLP